MKKENDFPFHMRKTITTLWQAVSSRLWLVTTIMSLAATGLIIGHVSYVPEYTASSSINVKNTKKASLADHLDLARLNAASAISEKLYWYSEHIKSEEFHYEVAKALKFSSKKEKVLLKRASGISLLKSVDLDKTNLLEIGSNQWIQKEINKLKVDILKVPLDELAQFIGQSIKVKTAENKIFIKVKSIDAQTSKLIANTVAKKFEELTNKMDSQGLENIEAVLQEKVEALKERMQEQEMRLVKLKKEGSSNMEGTSAGVSLRISNLEREITNLEIEIDENNSLIESHKKRIQDNLNRISISDEKMERAKGFKSLVLSLKNQIYLMRKQNISEDNWRLQKAKTELRKLLKEGKKHADVLARGNLQDDRDLAGFEVKVTELKAKNSTLRSRLLPLKEAHIKLTKQRSALPAIEQEILAQQRLVDRAYGSLDSYKQKLWELKIRKLSLDKKVQVRSLAHSTKATTRLDFTSKLFFTIFASLFFSILLCLCLELIDPHISSKEDLAKLGIPYVGEIPFFAESKDPAHDKLFYNSIENTPIYDYIRARLLKKDDGNSTVILLASANSGEGKSVTAINLAASLAKTGRKTLLIDGDLRRPSLHRLLKVPNDMGVANVFEDGEPLENVIFHNCLPGLDFLPAGMPQYESSTFFCSDAFRQLVKYLRKEYDYILFDSPPTLALPDAPLIAKQSDIVCSLAKFGKTTSRDLADVQDKIREISGADVKGIIAFTPTRTEIASYYAYAPPVSSKKNMFQMDYKFVEGTKRKQRVRESERQTDSLS